MKKAFFGMDKYLPGGEVAQKLQQRQQVINEANAARDKAVAAEMVPAMLGLGVLGVGAGMTGTKLYNLISRLNKPKSKYTKFGPGPHGLDSEEKLAGDWKQTLIDALTAIPNRVGAAISAGNQNFGKLDQNQQAILMPLGLASAGLGLYGGNAIVRGLEDRKKKEDAEYELEEARKDYQRALTGKRAEDLSAAFNVYAKSAQEKQAVIGAIKNTYDWFFEPLRRSGLLPYYSTAVLGTGLLSGKMTYDWARERSADKALERARRSRARLEDSSPLYIDPAQLEAIKTLHQKEVDKIKQKELG